MSAGARDTRNARTLLMVRHVADGTDEALASVAGVTALLLSQSTSVIIRGETNNVLYRCDAGDPVGTEPTQLIPADTVGVEIRGTPRVTNTHFTATNGTVMHIELISLLPG